MDSWRLWKRGDRVRVRKDAAQESESFRGRTGTFVKYQRAAKVAGVLLGDGLARVKMDDVRGTVTRDGTALFHPESLERGE
jgi:hypothetical protein